MARLRSALFVDFDNVASTLKSASDAAARRFATQPGIWMDALARGHLLPFPAEDVTERAILLRRCYANPDILQRWQGRAFFVRAGFSVVDCPKLTEQGKNSADIHMVIDALDVLNHSTRFDEIIVLSADADFTPLLTRVRMHDRHTAVFSSHETSAAYRAVADELLDVNDFVDFLAPVVEPPMPLREDTELALTMVSAVERRLISSGGPLPTATAAALATEAAGGNNRNWAGHGRFANLLERHLGPRFELAREADQIRIRARPEKAGSSARNGSGSPADRPGQPPAASEPLPLELRDLVARVRQLTSCPPLPPEDHQRILTQFSEQLKVSACNPMLMSKDIRDRLAESGKPVGRASVQFVLRGVELSGHRFGVDDGPAALAAAYRVYLDAACEQAGFIMPDADRALLHVWIPD